MSGTDKKPAATVRKRRMEARARERARRDEEKSHLERQVRSLEKQVGDIRNSDPSFITKKEQKDLDRYSAQVLSPFKDTGIMTPIPDGSPKGRVLVRYDLNHLVAGTVLLIDGRPHLRTTVHAVPAHMASLSQKHLLKLTPRFEMLSQHDTPLIERSVVKLNQVDELKAPPLVRNQRYSLDPPLLSSDPSSNSWEPVYEAIVYDWYNTESPTWTATFNDTGACFAIDRFMKTSASPTGDVSETLHWYTKPFQNLGISERTEWNGAKKRIVAAGIKVNAISNEMTTAGLLEGGVTEDDVLSTNIDTADLQEMQTYDLADGCTVRFDPATCLDFDGNDYPYFWNNGSAANHLVSANHLSKRPIIRLTWNIDNDALTHSNAYSYVVNAVQVLEFEYEDWMGFQPTYVPEIGSFTDDLMLISKAPLVAPGHSFMDFIRGGFKGVRKVLSTALNGADRAVGTVERVARVGAALTALA